jgi:hypothetical protein
MTWNRLLLAVMAAVIVYLSYGLYEEKHRDRGRLAVIPRNDHVVLVWGTRVDVPMRARFQEAFDQVARAHGPLRDPAAFARRQPARGPRGH